MKTKVINFYGGPGSGKSTMAAGLFSKLKFAGVNCEYVQEYAKDIAWEFNDLKDKPLKLLEAQEYIFAKQHYRMRRLSDGVDLIITDSPLLLGLVYMSKDFALPSLKNVVKEANDLYDNRNFLLTRQKKYNPMGRFQTEEQALEIDVKINKFLIEQNEKFTILSGTENSLEIIKNLYLDNKL
jgi:nicotinamide riboside kinase